MKKTTITHEEAQKTIWGALETLRGRISSGEENWETILDLLLWAALIPSTKDGLIGYFDAMQSISDGTSWEEIQAAIDKECGREQDERSNRNKITSLDIERLRSMLLPLARALASGVKEERKIISEALLQTREGLIGKAGNFDCTYSMGQFWKEVWKGKPSSEIACLYPMGVGAAIYLSEDHTVQTHTANRSQGNRLKGLTRLLNQEIKPLNPKGGWSISIACPPWREISREPITNDPWLDGAELQCPDSIKDIEAKRIYSAHQLCKDKTYALASPAIGFSGLKDLEFFRQQLIKKNWLDAIVELPAGVHPGTNIGGLLLVLSHTRKVGDKVAVISGERVIDKGKSKAGSEWNQVETKALISLLSTPKESEICKLVATKEIEDNGYKFQVSRYLQSEDEAAIEAYLENRDTLQLGDIAEIKRPLASLGKKSEEGVFIREATLGDISSSGLIEEGSKLVQIPEAVITKGRDLLLDEGDVLLSIKGSIGKAAVVGELEEPTFPGQAFCVVKLRPNAPLSANALVQYLRSEIGQSLFQKRLHGTGVAFIPMGEVKSIPIIIPSDEENKRSKQLKARTSKLSFEIKCLTNELGEISRNGWLEDFTPTHRNASL